MLTKLVLERGGRIEQLMLPNSTTKGMGTMNPSIFVDENRVLVNIRLLNYILYHNESQRYQHVFGPLQYIHPEDDVSLTTRNFIAELDDDLKIKWVQPVDTSKLDVAPIWEFVGLEDARLFKDHDRYFLAGVRRDTTINGEGRMEASEITITPDKVTEISRVRIPAPPPNKTYCEKNWMPVIGAEPLTFIKWCNPVEVVRFQDGKTRTISLKPHTFNFPADLRGGSQAVPFQGGYLAITHEVFLHRSDLGSKNATYLHRFVFFDKEYNLTKVSKSFSFLGADIEFCCGLALHKGKALITFGFQDNSAFVLETPIEVINEQLTA